MKRTILNHVKRLVKRSPTIVVIDLFKEGKCNSRCAWCNMRYQYYHDRALFGLIDFATWVHFLELNKDDKFPLIAYGTENLIYPDFIKYMNYALDNGWTIQDLHTNFSMKLKDDVFFVLVRHKNLNINVGGATPETHYSNMKTSLKQVLDNLHKLWAIRIETESNLHVTVKMVINKHNVDEQALLRQTIEKVSPEIKVVCSPIYFTTSNSSEEDKKQFFLDNLATPEGKLDKRIPTRDFVAVNNGGTISVRPKSGACSGLVPTIRPDGSINICCRCRWYGLSAGNAWQTPMKEIISSSIYRRYIGLARQRQYCEYCKYCS